MSKRVYCRDYRILKLRYYADKHILDYWYKAGKGPGLPRQHHQRAKLYVEYFWQLVEHMSGHNMKWWIYTYPFNARDCAVEYLEAEHDFINVKREGWDVWMIPKTKSDVVDWIWLNCPIPIKEISKMNLGSVWGRKRKTDWRRKESVKFREEHPEFQKVYEKIILGKE